MKPEILKLIYLFMSNLSLLDLNVEDEHIFSLIEILISLLDDQIINDKKCLFL